MDDRILAALETFPAPLILCDEQDFIVFANVRAQGLLLDVDVIDIPILGFIPLWHLCRPAGSQPAKTTVAEIKGLKDLGAAGVLIKPFDPRTLAADLLALLK